MVITILYQQNILKMYIKDNGKGFFLSKNRHYTNVGMDSMRERAKIINGILEVKSEPGNGTIISLKVKNL